MLLINECKGGLDELKFNELKFKNCRSLQNFQTGMAIHKFITSQKNSVMA